MAAAIQKQTGLTAELIPSRGGIFDVVIDGRRIYSKQQTGRFPTDDEILCHFKT